MERSFPKKIKARKSRNQRMRRFLLSILLFILLISIYVTIDYKGPKEIKLRSDDAFGLSCQRARGLIVQEYDIKGNLWATRGMIIYKLEKGSNKFTRVKHIPTGLSIFWLRNFSILRRLTVRPECIEMVITGTGDICALSAGSIWYFSEENNKFIKTFELAHYGFGDQGIRNVGIVSVNDSTLYFGEYFRNLEKTSVRVFKSENSGRSWKVVKEFKPGQIRHIHAIQKDPYSDRLWICTGDGNEESMVAYTQDDFKTIVPIGQGNQIWRVCQLVFTEDAIYWGTDNGNKDLAGIYKWERKSTNLTKLCITDGAIFYGTILSNGTIIMSTDREAMRIEKDENIRLWVTKPGSQPVSILWGTWKHKQQGMRFKFAKARFQRDQGKPFLAITCLNQVEFPDGELVIISEDTLTDAIK